MLIDEKRLAELCASGEFDAEWYCERYPDVAASGLDAIEHFLWLGQRLGRQPNGRGGKLDRVIDIAFSEEHREASGFRSAHTFIDAEKRRFLQRLRVRPAAKDYKYRPLISILMPTYKSNIKFLDMAVNSVIRQSYSNWEMIIVDDGSDSEDINKYFDNIRLRELRDRRITIQSNVQNRGISAATNDALALARGEFIALLDHDDILTLDALACCVDVLNSQPGLDLIYSDECRVNEADIPLDMFCKPDWSSAMLLNYMYTGHFSVYRRAMVERVGGFRSEYDFSQDYDLALRVTELTQRIYHIPELLYGWRAIAGSGAAGGKDYARETNIAALQDAMRRRGIAGTAVALPTTNRIDRRGLMAEPLVSIIVPSDNSRHISETVRAITKGTDYKNYEIVIVTNSILIDKLKNIGSDQVKFVAFDKSFNFSAKCNAGVDAAQGDFYCFFNDDVRPISRDWIEALLEYGLMSDVGAVGAKLLYEDDTIQHAGMVTGVRNLLGTAFHGLPGNTGLYFNMAQCVRDVSLLCGALVLVSRSVFHAIGGWDEVDFSIAHSDVDLCLKIQAAGMRCVYTPYAELCHIGHVSIKQEEEKVKNRAIDKADIALLRKYPEKISHDPYFTKQMRRQFYHDSEEYFCIYPGAVHPLRGGKDILLVSHELSQSGAPMVLVQVAEVLRQAGHFVVVIAPEDGPVRERLCQLGASVIIDELLFYQHDSFYKFAYNFDMIFCNTIVSWPVIEQMAGSVSTIMYLHEGDHMRHMMNGNPRITEALARADKRLAVSHVPARILAEQQLSYGIMPYGFNINNTGGSQRMDGALRIVVIGSYEPRKAQDLAIIAIQGLREYVDHPVTLRCFGRLVDRSFREDLETLFCPEDPVFLGVELDHQDSIQEILAADILLIPSRDDPLPIVATEAMAMGKIVVASAQTGTADYIKHHENGFIARSSVPEDLASALAEAIAHQDRWEMIGHAARECYLQNFSAPSFAQRLLTELEFL